MDPTDTKQSARVNGRSRAGESPEMLAARMKRERRRLIGGFALLALVLIAVPVMVLYARGGGPVPFVLAPLRPVGVNLLAESTPQEQVLRTLRLAGIERAIAGDSRGTAVVRLELPSAQSSVDVAAGWQAGLAALRSAYPDARGYVVQVYGPGQQPLLEMTWNGADARAAGDDEETLRTTAGVRYLSSEGGGS